METYDLYLESGPMRKFTVVHVPALLGCTSNGPTTDDAVAGAPDAIRDYLRFLARAGERVTPGAPFRAHVAGHDTSGGFIGTGFLPTDAEALPQREANVLMKRLAAMHGDLRRLTAGLTAKQLDTKPAKGRTIRDMLRHVCGAEGSYLRGVSGASRIAGDVEKGKLGPHDALDRLHALEVGRLDAMPDDERGAVIMRGQSPWSARAAVRRMLEHCWEHYTDIARRLDKRR